MVRFITRRRVAVGIAAVASAVLGGGIAMAASREGSVPQAAIPAPESFIGLTPTRVLDTRIGIGAPQAPLGADSSLDLNLSAKVPANAVSVLLNVTVDQATEQSYITVWPKAGERPNSSLINPTPGEVAAGSILMPLGADRSVSIYNFAGTGEIIVDLSGYTVPSASGIPGPQGPAGPVGPKGDPGPATLPGFAYQGYSSSVIASDATDVVMLTVEVPAGTYQATVSGLFAFPDQGANIPPASVDCRLSDIEDVDGAPVEVGIDQPTADPYTEAFDMTAVVSPTGEATISFVCSVGPTAAPITTDDLRMTLVQLGDRLLPS